jgi:hypothetical protein
MMGLARSVWLIWSIWFVSFISLVWFNQITVFLRWRAFQHSATEGDWPSEFQRLRGDGMHCRLAVSLDT